MSDERRRESIRKNVTLMIDGGATTSQLNEYIGAERTAGLPGLSIGDLFDERGGAMGPLVRQMQVRTNQREFNRNALIGPTPPPGSEIPEPIPPGSDPNAPTESSGVGGTALGTAGMLAASAAFPASIPARAAAPMVASKAARLLPMLKLGGAQAVGAGGGFLVGDIIEQQLQGGGTREEMKSAMAQAAAHAVLAPTTLAATAGVANIMGFFRGVAEPGAKAALDFAKRGGRKALDKSASLLDRAKEQFRQRLPAPAEDFAPGTLAAKTAKATIMGSFAGRLQRNQAGISVARFFEQQLARLGGKNAIVDEANAVERFAGVLRDTPGLNGSLFAQGVGKNLENPTIFLEKLFSPANKDMLLKMKNADPDLFADTATAWIQSMFRAHRTTDTTSPMILFDGAGIRLWYEGQKDFLKTVFGAEHAAVLDGFTSYMKFATPLAERAFQTGKVVDKVPALATDAAIVGSGTAAFGPIGAFSVSAYEGVMGGLAWALARPGNPIYAMLRDATSNTATRTARSAVQAGAQVGLNE